MMPFSVVVCKRTYDLGEHVGADGLVEGRAESSIGHHAQLPRTPASVDSAVIRGGIRRPPEPTGDREVRGGYRKHGGWESIAGGAMLGLADLPRGVPRAPGRPRLSMCPEGPHLC